MKKRLATLIRIQGIQRDIRAREHHQAQEAALRAARDLEDKLKRIRAARSDFGEAQSLGANRETLWLYETYLNQAHQVLQEAENRVEFLDNEAEVRRSVLTNTFKVLKTYERYHEKLVDIDATDLRQREAKELDEIAIQGHGHSKAK